MNNRPEISYLVQNVLPLLTEQFDFPRQESEQAVKIDEIPIPMASGVKKPDVVYYHDDLPVLLLEAKRQDKSELAALNQAMDYATRYPVTKYSNGVVKPKLIIVSIGRQLNWYRRWVELVGDEAIDRTEKIDPLSYNEVLAEYGLVDLGKKQVLTATEFRSELISDLVAIYKKEQVVSPEVVRNVSEQLLAWLCWGDNYSSHEPYISLDGEHERQAQLRGIYKNIDVVGSLGPDAARVFRQFVLRAFQGQYNQYLTEPSIISFMYKLVGGVTPNTTVLDFECGSGGYITAAVDTFGVDLANVRGVDVNELPYLIAKTYLAIFFKQSGREAIESLPIHNTNGLYRQGNDWDVVIGNPAGGSKYDETEPKRHDVKEVLQNLQADLDNNGRDDSFSEYNFSIQQAVQSAKIGGKICLILPEGLFANSRDEILRKYITKYCKVLAIVSLPRGVFRRGTNTRSQNSGASSSNQKMSILLAQKTSEVVSGTALDNQLNQEYPVFLAQIAEQTGRGNDVETWLEPLLSVVAEQWQSWQQTGVLVDMPILKTLKTKPTTPQNTSLLVEASELSQEPKPEAPKPKVETSINKGLEGLFKKFKVDD